MFQHNLNGRSVQCFAKHEMHVTISQALQLAFHKVPPGHANLCQTAKMLRLAHKNFKYPHTDDGGQHPAEQARQPNLGDHTLKELCAVDPEDNGPRL